MFEKMRFQVRNDGLVRAADGSCIAAESASGIFCFFPKKAVSFICDRSCGDNGTKTCKHVILSTEKYGELQHVVNWFH